MEGKQPGNKNMPDFKELNDRIIAEPSTSPSLVIKTNADPESAVEDNPYAQGVDQANLEKLKGFFEGREHH
ncbi:hypothetical protein [Bacillus sp. 165]|uniref:hypothetical protein n=1 Tax=Bacillus sp. 165 TaxID=1529117 RepID=UPI001ADC81A9|nr:hypothetical protein [Bacillus sp. 165]MBO9129159.1 hypothetical protein [Bacillus sp. 165]